MSENNQKEKIAIFGFKDSLVGQFIEISNINNLYHIEYFISVHELPNLNIKNEHINRPNNKTEFIVDGKIFGAPVYEGTDYIERLIRDKIKKVFVLEDYKKTRKEIIEKLINSKINVLSKIHSTVYLGGHNSIGVGVIIFPQCYISYKTDIGTGTIIQSNSTIEHHNVVGDYCDINPNVTTGGFTNIGDFSTIHISTTIIDRINIGKNCKIGAGSLVLNDCEEGYLYYGSPSKRARALNV